MQMIRESAMRLYVCTRIHGCYSVPEFKKDREIKRDRKRAEMKEISE